MTNRKPTAAEQRALAHDVEMMRTHDEAPTIQPDADRPVYVAGNATVHMGRAIGRYPSGARRYRKLCSSSRNERHNPSPLAPETEVTCKRCLAKIATRDDAQVSR